MKLFKWWCVLRSKMFGATPSNRDSLRLSPSIPLLNSVKLVTSAILVNVHFDFLTVFLVVAGKILVTFTFYLLFLFYFFLTCTVAKNSLILWLSSFNISHSLRNKVVSTQFVSIQPVYQWWHFVCFSVTPQNYIYIIKFLKVERLSK